MAELPTHPNIFGVDPSHPEHPFRLAQLHITGASFVTKGDAPSVPTHLIIGYKWRRWELVISDAYETDRHGKRLTPGQASTPPAPQFPADISRGDLVNRILELEADKEKLKTELGRMRQEIESCGEGCHIVGLLKEKLENEQRAFNHEHALYEQEKEFVREAGKKLDMERQEREGLYPVIDEMKRVRATLEADNKRLDELVTRLQAKDLAMRQLRIENGILSVTGKALPPPEPDALELMPQGVTHRPCLNCGADLTLGIEGIIRIDWTRCFMLCETCKLLESSKLNAECQKIIEKQKTEGGTCMSIETLPPNCSFTITQIVPTPPPAAYPPKCLMVDGMCNMACDFYGADEVPSGYPCSKKAPTPVPSEKQYLTNEDLPVHLPAPSEERAAICPVHNPRCPICPPGKLPEGSHWCPKHQTVYFKFCAGCDLEARQ